MESKQIKAIADSHIEAKMTGVYNECHVADRDQLIQKLIEGHTFKQLIDLIELNYVSIQSQLMSGTLGYVSDSYRKSVYKGFKEVLKWKS
jgi:hypothetical protein